MYLERENQFDEERNGTGTREWSEHSVNIGFGCSHGCKYCYAMAIMNRFGRIKNKEEWTTETVDLKKSRKGYQLRKGVIMFPTTHDITPYYLPYAIESLEKMLAPGNKVLIVSKPHIDCVRTLCDKLNQYRNQIEFRFTIGTLDASLSKLWEPGAPAPAERIESLKHAYKAGYVTSVSMEPMLGDVDDALRTFQAVLPYSSDTVWIGKMNQARHRVGMAEPMYAAAINRIEEQQRDNEILRLVSLLGVNPKVRWKDSIKKVMSKSSSIGRVKEKMGSKTKANEMTLREAMIAGSVSSKCGEDGTLMDELPIPKDHGEATLKAEALSLIDTGMSSKEVAQKLGLKTQQVAAYKAHKTRGTYCNTPQPDNGKKPVHGTVTDTSTVRIILDLPTSMVEEIDFLLNGIGVEREALMKVWLYERIQAEKAT